MDKIGTGFKILMICWEDHSFMASMIASLS